MSDQGAQEKGKRDRSPSYPAISLRTAIERLVAFDEYFKRHPAPIKNIGSAWGIKPSSSQANSVVAALKSYGLVDYQGSGNDLKAVLTEDGRTYLRAQQEDTKKQVLARCALKPKAIGIYFSQWGKTRPPDEVCLDELVLKAKFSPVGAENFLKVYDSTIAFAELSDSDKIKDDSEANSQKIKDGVPDRGANDSAEDFSQGMKRRPVVVPLGANMRQDIFSIEEGAVTIQWPATLSTDSLKDVEDWLEIVKRKITRSLAKPEVAKPEVKDEPS